jgi:hypothetical protein
MPRTKISEFSATAASNTDIDSINIAEGCAPSGINDAIRELMAQLKDFQTGAVGDSFNGPVGSTTAAAGAFTTLAASGAVTLSGGTANGVAYLNGSKVVTSGSALTFSGSELGVNATSTDASMSIQALTANYASVLSLVANNDNGAQYNNISSSTSGGTVHWRIGGVAGVSQLPFSIAGTEQMRLTSTGLGIGTSSPSAKLDVVATYSSDTASQQRFRDNTGVSLNFGGTGGGKKFIQAQDSAGAATYYDIIINPLGGNLGLGVTPSGWGGIFRTMQLGSDGAWVGGRTDSQNQAWIGTNAYYNGSNWIYKAATTAGQMLIKGNEFQFLIAPTGSIGGTATFTQAMTLDASGNLGVGTTNTVNSRLYVANSGVANLIIGYNNTSNNYYDADTQIFRNSSAVERARIDSSGNLLVGTTSTTNGALINWYKASGTIETILGGTTSAQNHIVFANPNGNVGSIQVAASLTTYNATSDYRLKNVIGAVSNSGERIDALEPIEYTWKVDGLQTRGFLAHKFQEVYPNSVNGEKDAVDDEGNPVHQTMQASTAEVIADLVAEIQSLRKRLADAGI